MKEPKLDKLAQNLRDLKAILDEAKIEVLSARERVSILEDQIKDATKQFNEEIENIKKEIA